MNCPNCGNDVIENQKFCTKCGYSVNFNKIFEHENLEIQVLTKCAVIAVVIAIIITFVKLTGG